VDFIPTATYACLIVTDAMRGKNGVRVKLSWFVSVFRASPDSDPSLLHGPKETVPMTLPKWIAAALALLLVSSAHAQTTKRHQSAAVEPAPTIGDAHAYIAELVNNGGVHRYESNGPNESLSSYKGDGCHSTFAYSLRGGTVITVSVDWSLISSASSSDSDVVMSGATSYQRSDNADVGSETTWLLVIPDSKTANRVVKAVSVLMKGCQNSKATKFD
jgi:hypothetical protein